MTVRSGLLPVFDKVRGILADMELGPNRLTDVSLRITTWDGGAPGIGTPTVTTTPLTLDAAGHRVKVEIVSSHEIIASGGKYQDGDYQIGPFTPSYAGGGRAPSYIDPPADGAVRDVVVILNGPGLDNVTCRIINTSTDKTFRYMMTVRRTNQG